MADEDVKTRLIVEGGQAFVRTLTEAARAQEQLNQVLANANNLGARDINTAITETAQVLNKASVQAEKFKEQLAATGTTDEIINKVTSSIERQSKALLDNSKAVEAAREAELQLQATRAANREANLREVPQGVQRGLGLNQNNDVAQGTFNFGRVSNFGTAAETTAIQQNLQRQQTAFLEKEVAIRQAVEERAAVANEARSRRVTEIAVAEERKKTLAVLQSEQESRANALFRQSAPQAIVNGPSNINSRQSQQQAALLAGSISQQSAAQQDATRSGVTYLSTLSAIHSLSFLATGTTFSFFQSVGTLALAFSKVNVPAGEFNSKMFAAGGALGFALAGIGAVVQAGGQVINFFEQGAIKALQFGAAGVAAFVGVAAAATKLASASEEVFAEIAAFGSPTIDQFNKLDNLVSDLARNFGQSASAIGEGASLFIRAGGNIETALNGGVRAVTLLQTASRGELIPAQAARSIVTVTNAFKGFEVTAEEAANIIVGTAQKSALSFNEVTQAFQQAAPTAALLKIPLLDLAATIGVLSNEGLKGQVAGTGFKQFLLDLLKPSKDAREKLAELGVSIEDQNHRVRPLIDIFADLHKALGDEADALDKTGDASKAQSLALIFGSRANLAAAIIARTGAEAFTELKDAIAAVSAEDVVSILLTTTASQAKILQTNVEELARAFGGPLNAGIGSALTQINTFLKGIDRKNFEAAAQGVLAVISGGGFDVLVDKLSNIDDSRVKSFFENVLNAALTVRNAIVSELIPAFQQAGTNISNALNSRDITRDFSSITSVIVGLINAGSRLIIFISELAADFIEGNARGKELQDALRGIATTVGASLVGAFALAATTIGIATLALKAFGEQVIQIAGFTDLVSEATNKVHLTGLTKEVDILKHDSNTLDSELLGIVKRLDEIDKAKVSLTQQDTPSSTTSSIEQQALDIEKDRLLQRREDIKAIQQQQHAEIDRAQTEIAGIEKSQTLGQQLRAVLGQTETFNLDNFLNQLEGDVPAALTRISNLLHGIEDQTTSAPERDPTQGVNFPDPKAAAKVQREISDALRTADDERRHILEDAATHEIELQRSTFDRLVDLNTAYNRNIQKLTEDTDRRVAKSDRDFAQHRKDRDDLQVISRSLELESFLREQANSKRDLLIQQSDALEDRSNQRRVQAAETINTQLENREQHRFDVQNQIADRAFSRAQADSERRFTLQASREADVFERGLQDQARARQNAQRLASASPSDRPNVQRQIAQENLDTAFQRTQDEQRRQFREKQDVSRIAFTRAQEDNQFQHTLTNEQKTFDFRIGLELKYLQIRHQLEDAETERQNGVESNRLERRLGFAQEDFGFRLQQSDKLQVAQDALADQQHARETKDTRDEAELRKKELGQKLVEDTFGIFDDADRRRLQNQDQSLKQLRNLTERTVRQLQQIEEREPTGAGAAQQGILQLNLQLIETDLLFKRNTLDAETFFRTIRNSSLEGQGLVPEAPRRSATFAVPAFSPEVNQSLAQAQQIDFRPLITFLPPAIADALRNVQLNTNGGDRSITIQGDVTPDVLQKLQRLLTIGN